MQLPWRRKEKEILAAEPTALIRTAWTSWMSHALAPSQPDLALPRFADCRLLLSCCWVGLGGGRICEFITLSPCKRCGDRKVKGINQN